VNRPSSVVPLMVSKLGLPKHSLTPDSLPLGSPHRPATYVLFTFPVHCSPYDVGLH
jgi:hypothetical protein